MSNTVEDDPGNQAAGPGHQVLDFNLICSRTCRLSFSGTIWIPEFVAAFPGIPWVDIAVFEIEFEAPKGY